MAQADTALALQDGLGARIEHIRYLSLHDLLAMMAMQYQNVGLDALWSLLEHALLGPMLAQEHAEGHVRGATACKAQHKRRGERHGRQH